MSGNSEEIEWYLARDGQQFGPLSDTELKKVIDLGHLKPDDLLWRAGMDEWEKSDNIFPQSTQTKDAKPKAKVRAKAKASDKTSAASDATSTAAGNGEDTPSKPAKPIYRAEPGPALEPALEGETAAKPFAAAHAKIKSDEERRAKQGANGREKDPKAPDAQADRCKKLDPGNSAKSSANKPSPRGGANNLARARNAQSPQANQRAMQKEKQRGAHQSQDTKTAASAANNMAAAKSNAPAQGPGDKTNAKQGRRAEAATGRAGPNDGHNQARGRPPIEPRGKPRGRTIVPPRNADQTGQQRRDNARQSNPDLASAGSVGRTAPGGAQRSQGQPARHQKPAQTQRPANPVAAPSPVLGSVARRQATGVPASPDELNARRQGAAGNRANQRLAPKRKRRVVLPILLLSAIGGAGWLAYSGDTDFGSMLGQYYSKAVSTGKSLAATYIPGAANTGAASAEAATAKTDNSQNSAAPKQPPKPVQVALKTPANAPGESAAPTAPMPAPAPAPAPAQFEQSSAAPTEITVTMAPQQDTAQDAPAGTAQGTSQTPAAPTAPANPLQSSQLWRYIEQEFPDWYAKRAFEAATLQEEKLGNHAIVRLMDQKMIALRRQYASMALASSQQHLKAIASSFLTMVQVLSKHSITACYGFISHGESAPEVAQLLQDQTFSTHLDAQSLAIVQAVVNGQNSPQTHKPPEPEDYRALAAELTSRGWSKNDLQLFTDPVALANAKPAKVCSMVQDWFSAQLALPDSAAQLRLLVQSLRPVIAG